MFRLLVTVAQSKRCFTSWFVSFKTVSTTESETTEAIMQTTEAQTSPTKPSGKSTLHRLSNCIMFTFALDKQTRVE